MCSKVTLEFNLLKKYLGIERGKVMECKSCGAIVEESNFCSKCGTKVENICKKEEDITVFQSELEEEINENIDNQKEKKEMTKKEIKQMKLLEKKMANLNKKFKEDQELINKYLVIENRTINLRNVGAIITMINVMAFQSSVVGGIGWGMIIISMSFHLAYYLTKCKRNLSIVLSIVFSIVFIIILGILLSLGETYFGDGY